MRKDLGTPDDFPRLPALVEIGIGFYYLTRKGGRWALLSTLCPHAGGEVVWRPEEAEYVCPAHGWRFGPDGRMGKGCPGLRRYPVRERGGRLVAELPG